MSDNDQIDWGWMISALRPNQRDVLGQIAMNCDAGHHRATLAKLERLGLIARLSETLPGLPPLTITRYYLPISVHNAWCRWCSENVPVPEMENENAEPTA